MTGKWWSWSAKPGVHSFIGFILFIWRNEIRLGDWIEEEQICMYVFIYLSDL